MLIVPIIDCIVRYKYVKYASSAGKPSGRLAEVMAELSDDPWADVWSGFPEWLEWLVAEYDKDYSAIRNKLSRRGPASGVSVDQAAKFIADAGFLDLPPSKFDESIRLLPMPDEKKDRIRRLFRSTGYDNLKRLVATYLVYRPDASILEALQGVGSVVEGGDINDENVYDYIEKLVDRLGGEPPSTKSAGLGDWFRRILGLKDFGRRSGPTIGVLWSNMPLGQGVDIKDAEDFVMTAVEADVHGPDTLYESISKLPVPPGNRSSWAVVITAVPDPWVRELLALYLIRNPSATVEEAFDTYSRLLQVDKDELFGDIQTYVLNEDRFYKIYDYLKGQ